jgi:hypothetical protein
VLGLFHYLLLVCNKSFFCYTSTSSIHIFLPDDESASLCRAWSPQNSGQHGSSWTSLYTDMLVNAKAAHGSNEPWEALSARTPFGNGEVPMDEVVNTILFMLSDMAPSVTGQYLAINGEYQNA